MTSPLLMKGWSFSGVSYQPGEVYYYYFFISFSPWVVRLWIVENCHFCSFLFCVLMLESRLLLLFFFFCLLLFSLMYVSTNIGWSSQVKDQSSIHAAVLYCPDWSSKQHTRCTITPFRNISPSVFLDIPKTELMISLNLIFFGYYYTSFIKSLTLTLFWGFNFQLN